ncbi:protein fem-1 homolog C isoform X1 [Nematostella vectensis]|uniref:protein fem-1 homolog C isoform X1 n=1 Tax=Nematostella vectensis TaxID=45351 RepID=UPI0020776A19|nr:protein fem-1 homolog C isoform X1 [Nematostella vectensis]
MASNREWQKGFIAAIQEGDLNSVQEACQGDVTGALNTLGFRALHFLAEGKKFSPEVFEWLCDKGCDINASTKKGKTSLHLAAESGNTEMVMQLLQKCADVNKTDEYGNNALHFAAKSGEAKVLCELLIKCHHQVNTTNEDSETPMFWAVKSLNKESVRILRSYDANADKKSLLKAKTENRQDITEILKSPPPPRQTIQSLLKAKTENRQDITEILESPPPPQQTIQNPVYQGPVAIDPAIAPGTVIYITVTGNATAAIGANASVSMSSSEDRTSRDEKDTAAVDDTVSRRPLPSAPPEPRSRQVQE